VFVEGSMPKSNRYSEHAAFIEEMRVFWSRRAGRELTKEDAEQISEKLYEFTTILREWYMKDQLRKSFIRQLHLLMQSGSHQHT